MEMAQGQQAVEPSRESRSRCPSSRRRSQVPGFRCSMGRTGAAPDRISAANRRGRSSRLRPQTMPT